MFLLGVVLMVIGVAASIALHELGHMLPAKKFGVKVTQYMIGFGPTIFSRRRGETEYGVKAIPLGGYIRMVGMFPPAPGDPSRVRTSSTGRWSQLVDQAREAAFEEIPEHEAHRVFYKLLTHRKVIIMFGGPFMNLVIAAALLVVISCVIGLPTATNTADVASISKCLPTQSGAPASSCTTPSPAVAAGLQPQDRIESVDGIAVSTTMQATNVIRAHPDQQIPMVIVRNGVRRTLTITPALRTVPKTDAQGNPVKAPSGQVETVRAGQIGAGIGGVALVRAPITQAPSIVGDGLTQTASVFVKIPQKMVGVFNAAFGNQKRDQNGPMSVVGVGRIAGDVTENSQFPLVAKVDLLLGLLASLNLALFVFNLIPLLPLDGGHIAGALWESVKRPIARARGIQGPIYVDVAKALPVAYGVSMVLLVMFGLLFYADIVNPITLN